MVPSSPFISSASRRAVARSWSTADRPGVAFTALAVAVIVVAFLVGYGVL
jgi:hypothetical protein